MYAPSNYYASWQKETAFCDDGDEPMMSTQTKQPDANVASSMAAHFEAMLAATAYKSQRCRYH